MNYLIAGIVIFMVPHFYSALRTRQPERDIKAKIGEGPYMGLYSIVSVIGLGLIIFGYLISPSMDLLYAPPTWTRHITIVAMALAFVLIVSAYVPGNHIKRIVRHPMLLATLIWAASHLLTPTDTKELLLFGSFLLFAAVDAVSAFRRTAAPSTEASLKSDAIVVAIAFVAFLGTAFWLHAYLYGVSVW